MAKINSYNLYTSKYSTVRFHFYFYWSIMNIPTISNWFKSFKAVFNIKLTYPLCEILNANNF